MPSTQRGATGRNNKKIPRRPIDAFLSARNDLDERQQNAVALLLRGFSDQEVATELHVDRGTIFRWRKGLPFLRELDRQRRLLWEQSANQLQAMVQPALEILRAQLSGDDPKMRIRAAAILLRFATPSRLPRPTAEKQVRDDTRQYVDDVIAYVEAPLPGQPGAPEDMVEEELEDEEDS